MVPPQGQGTLSTGAPCRKAGSGSRPGQGFSCMSAVTDYRDWRPINSGKSMLYWLNLELGQTALRAIALYYKFMASGIISRCEMLSKGLGGVGASHRYSGSIGRRMSYEGMENSTTTPVSRLLLKKLIWYYFVWPDRQNSSLKKLRAHRARNPFRKYSRRNLMDIWARVDFCYLPWYWCWKSEIWSFSR